MNYHIKIFETSKGKKPLSEWMSSLSDKKIRAAFVLRIERLEMGNFGQCKSLGQGIHELKIDIGPGYRIYFAKIGLQIILLLSAGDKKSQQKDILKARQYLQDFKNNNRGKK